ncbi:Hpt domain-containing protein [Planctomicrobium sp. SH527]|uniref:Hpt domain-containing protein n=1 Tax=Planctomicrobium sp. SH527 TaxID=3448123 RepID=UPI003F5B0FD3
MMDSIPEVSDTAKSHPKDSSEPLVDFKALAARCLGNQALMLRVITRFQTSLEERKTEFQTAIAGRQWESLRQMSHRLKGEAANVEAIQIRDAARQIEQSTEIEDERGAQQAVDQLISALQLFQTQVQISPINP